MTTQVDPLTHLPAGTLIEGRYRLTRALPDPDVQVESYEGVQLALERPVLVKVLRREAKDRSDLKERFLREGRALARLDHPHIAHVLELGEIDGRPFVVRDHGTGRLLEEWWAEGRRFSWGEVHQITSSLLSALTALHAEGLVHRGLSGRSVALDERARPSIVDFQEVQLSNPAPGPKLTGLGMVLGDPRSASPEHLMGFATDPRSDLYSLGVLAYRMLVGHFPYSGNTPALLLAEQSRPVPSWWSPVNVPEGARPLAELVTQLLAIAPEARPHDAQAAAQRLGPAPALVELPRSDFGVEGRVQLPRSELSERWEALLATAVGGWRRAQAQLQRAIGWGLPRWRALGQHPRRAITGGAGVFVVCMLALLATPNEEVVASEVASVESLPAPSPPPDAATMTMLEEARSMAKKKRVEAALEAYLRAATRDPQALGPEDLDRVIGYLARKDWLTSVAEKILVRVGPRATPALQRAAEDPRGTPFLRRRAAETLQGL